MAPKSKAHHHVVVQLFLLSFLINLSVTETTPEPTPAKCLVPMEIGNCRARFPRFGYNSTTEKCELFFYGGCGGNSNRFRTKKECMKKCRVPKEATETTPEPTPAKCLEPIETGDCKGSPRGAFQRFGYNSTSKKCEPFVYGGCRGNSNRFKTEKECMKKCRVSKEGPIVCPTIWRPVCGSDDVTYSNLCFLKAANEENPNMEITVKHKGECKTTPEPTPAKCLEPMETGPCKGSFPRGSFPRFGYNSTSKKCEPFVYGGCGGNSNRFKTKKECMKKCRVSKEEPQEPCSDRSDKCEKKANKKGKEKFCRKRSHQVKCQKFCGLCDDDKSVSRKERSPELATSDAVPEVNIPSQEMDPILLNIMGKNMDKQNKNKVRDVLRGKKTKQLKIIRDILKRIFGKKNKKDNGKDCPKVARRPRFRDQRDSRGPTWERRFLRRNYRARPEGTR